MPGEATRWFVFPHHPAGLYLVASMSGAVCSSVQEALSDRGSQPRFALDGLDEGTLSLEIPPPKCRDGPPQGGRGIVMK